MMHPDLVFPMLRPERELVPRTRTSNRNVSVSVERLPSGCVLYRLRFNARTTDRTPGRPTDQPSPRVGSQDTDAPSRVLAGVVEPSPLAHPPRPRGRSRRV